MNGNLQEKGRSPEPRPTLCSSLRRQNAHRHVTRSILYGNLREKGRGPEPRPTLCASLRSRNAHQHVTRAILYRNLQEKCRGPVPRPTLFASLRSRTAHQHVTRAILSEIYWKNAAAQNHGADFVRACAGETHMNTSQEPLQADICWENAEAHQSPVTECPGAWHRSMSGPVR